MLGGTPDKSVPVWPRVRASTHWFLIGATRGPRGVLVDQGSPRVILGEQAGCKWPASSGRHNLEAPIGEDANADFPKIVWTRHPAHTFMDRILRLHSLLEEEGGWMSVWDLRLEIAPPPSSLGLL